MIVREELVTEQFIKNYMVGEQGLIYTNLQNINADLTIPAGKDSLSESIGLWMNYSTMKQDQELFQGINDVFHNYFLTNENVVLWKLESEGAKEVNANALIDDLRIIGALLDASELWNNTKYKKQALKLAETLIKNNEYKGYLTDFYDKSVNLPSKNIMLSYIDLKTIQKLYDYEIISTEMMHNMTQLFEDLPSDHTFYPISYSIDEQKYIYADEVHMIDQLYISYHLAQQGKVNDMFLSFLKGEIEKGKVYGRYDRNTLKQVVDYESPAVYGLAILYSLQAGEDELAIQLYNRMKEFRVKDVNHLYYGGYIDQVTGDTHIFDNLFPLLAERMILDEGLIHN